MNLLGQSYIINIKQTKLLSRLSSEGIRMGLLSNLIADFADQTTYEQGAVGDLAAGGEIVLGFKTLELVIKYLPQDRT